MLLSDLYPKTHATSQPVIVVITCVQTTSLDGGPNREPNSNIKFTACFALLDCSWTYLVIRILTQHLAALVVCLAQQLIAAGY